jgi:hypothetical protein
MESNPQKLTAIFNVAFLKEILSVRSFKQIGFTKIITAAYVVGAARTAHAEVSAAE